MARVNPISKGMHTLTPGLVLRDAVQAIEFYKKALGGRAVGGRAGGACRVSSHIKPRNLDALGK